MAYTSEFLTEVKTRVKVKLSELGAFADEELPDYIMVMVANKKKRESMNKDLNLFLGSQTENFTQWLHHILEKSEQSGSLKKDTTVELSDSRSTRDHRKEKRRRTSNPGNKRQKLHSRSRSPLSKKSTPLPELDSADILNVRADENEFNDEISLSAQGDTEKPCAKHVEQRRIVATSTLVNKNAEETEKTLPVIKSIVKVSTPPKRAQNGGSLRTSGGGMLLKRAMTEVKSNAGKFNRGTLKRSAPRSPPQRHRDSSAESDADSDGATEEKNTCFIVTMSKKAAVVPVSPRPSVKSRLGPRVVNVLEQDTSRSVLATPTDAREILRAKKASGIGKGAPMVPVPRDEELEEPEEEVGEDDDDDEKPNKGHIPSSLQRCKYWPNCRNADTCQFIHPREECKAFPNCRFGSDRCMYVHPPCRYGAQCSRPKCAFSHNTTTKGPASPPTQPITTQIPCRFFPHCKMPLGTCPFYHPPTPVCRYGAACLHRATTCPFPHPVPSSAPGPAPPTANKLKWVAPGKEKQKAGLPAVTAVKEKVSVKNAALATSPVASAAEISS